MCGYFPRSTRTRVAGLRAETLRIHGAGRVLRVRVAFQRRQMQPFHRFFRF